MVRIQAVGKPTGKVQAFIVGVDKDRKAPSLKGLGLEGEPILTRILGDQDVPMAWKTVRTLPTAKGWVVLVGMGDPKKLTQERLGTLANLGCRAAAGVGCSIAATTLVADSWRSVDLEARVHELADALAHGTAEPLLSPRLRVEVAGLVLDRDETLAFLAVAPQVRPVVRTVAVKRNVTFCDGEVPGAGAGVVVLSWDQDGRVAHATIQRRA